MTVTAFGGERIAVIYEMLILYYVEINIYIVYLIKWFVKSEDVCQIVALHSELQKSENYYLSEQQSNFNFIDRQQSVKSVD